MEGTQAQIPDNFHALHGIDVVVHIAHLDPRPLEIGGQILRHPFGQGGDQHPLVPGGTLVYLTDQVVDLALYGTDLNTGIQQTGGPDDLLHNLSGAGALVLPRGSGHIDHLVDPLLKLRKFQRPVVKGAGQAEAVVHQGGLAGPVPIVHGPHLGQGDMALVDKQNEVFWEIVQQGMGRRADGAAFNHP